MTIEMVTNNHYKNSKRYTVLLSDCDADLTNLLWTVIGPGYACNKELGYLHSLILSRMLGCPLVKGEETDHVNRNKIDNQRENIRLANSSMNKVNRELQRNNTTGYRGVGYSKKEKVWYARLTLNKNTKYLGGFHTPEEAAAAYDKAAREAQGEFFIGNDLH